MYVKEIDLRREIVIVFSVRSDIPKHNPNTCSTLEYEVKQDKHYQIPRLLMYQIFAPEAAFLFVLLYWR